MEQYKSILDAETFIALYLACLRCGVKMTSLNEYSAHYKDIEVIHKIDGIPVLTVIDEANRSRKFFDINGKMIHI